MPPASGNGYAVVKMTVEGARALAAALLASAERFEAGAETWYTEETPGYGSDLLAPIYDADNVAKCEECGDWYTAAEPGAACPDCHVTD
jgi:hypothetical protein